ncbi:hypothetical protein NPIL_347321 [Nephila pilipes]|uniref:Uncharacterized protein n=1 Tax=Nephila pilipes TaxID=299642 RepID=A0A8X6PB00_NEPPI|nr:hypothetical protein NPIL_347321 [Nephila pilipes]
MTKKKPFFYQKNVKEKELLLNIVKEIIVLGRKILKLLLNSIGLQVFKVAKSSYEQSYVINSKRKLHIGLKVFLLYKYFNLNCLASFIIKMDKNILLKLKLGCLR